MLLSLDLIHELEIKEDYPAAIDALEARLQANPTEVETIIRLGFNLWYAADEEPRLQKGSPVERYRQRFMQLLRDNQEELKDNSDFCWAFGLGLSLFGFEYPGIDSTLGDTLLARAKQLDVFYGRMDRETMNRRFARRGIWSSYYAINREDVSV